MIRLTRIVPLAVSLVAGFAATGCRSYSPLPLPSDASASGLSLSSTPSSLVIRPNSSGRVTFLLHDELGLPVPDYPLTFAIQGDGSGDGTANAQLSSEQGLTDSNGVAELEIMVGDLPSDNNPAIFSVAATCPGPAQAQADITVTTNTYSVEILPVPASDLLDSAAVVATRLWFYDDATCGALDLTNLNAAAAKPRAARFASATIPSVVFHGVAASGSHAVVGLGLSVYSSAQIVGGLDDYSSVQIGGCIDIPGASLLESETVHATLYMNRLFPLPLGTYQVKSDFTLALPPSALANVQAVWQQWARCPLDPARLWLDCTIDALATNPASDPLDCVPVPGAEGSLGELLFQRRGRVVAPLGGTTAGDTPCHGSTDEPGNDSLENIVDALFVDRRGQLQGATLGTFSDEIAALLANLHIDSQMTIAAGSDLNSYTIKHDLLVLTFPNALAPVSLATSTLGLPVSSVSGILATLKIGDQLSIFNHGFTLRLGTSARYAFEATSLKSRVAQLDATSLDSQGAQDSLRLVNAVYSLAQWSDQGTLLSGCSALAAAVCGQIQQPGNCLGDACQHGLDALAAKLAGAFNNLDGKALDFQLSGAGSLVDLDGDGRADAMGPGLCSAALDTQGGNYLSFGSWTAARVTNLP